MNIGFLEILILLIAFIFLATEFYRLRKANQEREKKISLIERRFHDNPNESKAAWDLARTKLENYLDRNLSLVRSIYWMNVFVMIAGLFLIGMGIDKAFQNPQALTASELTEGAGVVVDVISGAFLLLYRSTMSQAKGYVSILERINAVGMSIQILERMSDNNGELKDKATAEVAMQMLRMYAIEENGK